MYAMPFTGSASAEMQRTLGRLGLGFHVELAMINVDPLPVVKFWAGVPPRNWMQIDSFGANAGSPADVRSITRMRALFGRLVPSCPGMSEPWLFGHTWK